MLAIGRIKAVEHALLLEARLAQAMAMVLAQMDVARLLLGGGAPSAAMRQRWSRLPAVVGRGGSAGPAGGEDGQGFINRAVMTGPIRLAGEEN